MAGEALTPTSYIQHHLKNFTFQVGEGGFWAIHVDTLVTAVLMGLPPARSPPRNSRESSLPPR